MVEIVIDNVSFKIHPVYNLFAASKNGQIIHIVKQIPQYGHIHRTGYLYCNVRSFGQKNQKTYQAHRFVWECYNGMIQENKVIDHINNVKNDNRLENLQCVTQQENCKKSASKRDYSFANYNWQNRKTVKATNIESGEETIFKSLYAVQKTLGINCGIVKMCCEGINNCKSGISKINNQQYRFEYIVN